MSFYDYPEPLNCPKRVTIPQGPYPTRAFGYLLHHDCLVSWAERYYKKTNKTSISSLPEKDQKKAIDAILPATIFSIPIAIYHKLPNLPRFRRRMMLVDAYRETYLFVLKDDSSMEALSAPVSQEDLEQARKLLGVPEQQPDWYWVEIE